MSEGVNVWNKMNLSGCSFKEVMFYFASLIFSILAEGEMKPYFGILSNTRQEQYSLTWPCSKSTRPFSTISLIGSLFFKKS